MNAIAPRTRPDAGDRRSVASAIAVVLLLAAVPASAQESLRLPFLPANEIILENFSAEFPPIGPLHSSMRGRLMADHAERLLRGAPGAPETFEMLVYLERRDDVVLALQRMIRDDPRQLVRAFELLSTRNLFLPGRDVRLPPLLAEARAQLGRLTREDAAHLERTFIVLEHAGPQAAAARAEALQAFIARDAGTSAAQEAEVDLVVAGLDPSRLSAVPQRRIDPAARIAQLDDVARRYPGSTAAARALSQKALELSLTQNRAGVDPTDRFLEVFAIVEDLQSGRYPPSRWVTQAPWLAIEMRAREPVFAPGSLDRLLAAYVAFVRNHFTLPEQGRAAEGVSDLIAGPIADLFGRRGDGAAGVERLLADLEQIDAPRAQFVRSAFYVTRLAGEPPDARPAMLRRARAALSALAGRGSGLHARRALATLASLDYVEGDFAAARAAFETYLASHPETPWSWVAAIRIGQCQQLLGDLDDAIASFRTAAARYAAVPVARELGHAFAGMASEAAFRFADAAGDYERALTGWGDPRRAAGMESYRVRDAQPRWTPVRVDGIGLQTRVGQIRAALAVPEGPLFERGRHLLARDREAAVAAFDELLRTYPGSTFAAEARRLSHQARLDAATDLVGPASARRDETAAIAALDALGQEPWNEVVGVAKILRAALSAAHGDAADADARLGAALVEWQQHQVSRGASALDAEVERDVAAIRRRVFEEEDAGAPWRQRFEWRTPATRVRVVNPHVTVQLAGRVPGRETVYPTSAFTNLLFMTTDEMAMLAGALNALAGARGPSLSPHPPGVLSLLERHLPLERAMVGGGLLSFTSIPDVHFVRFTDEARTRAEVGIRTSFSGGTLFMEKDDGVWRVTGTGMTFVQ